MKSEWHDRFEVFQHLCFRQIKLRSLPAFTKRQPCEAEPRTFNPVFMLVLVATPEGVEPPTLRSEV
jgi:hypothetical protein